MLTKKELLGLWKAKGFHASKKLGQNFLIDRNVKDKIISFIDPAPHDDILEIGPGFGELTLPISLKAGHVTAVDKDSRVCDILRDNIFAGSMNIDLVNCDFLEYMPRHRYTKVVGNLPYYITTPIIEKLLLLDYKPIVYIMVQEEYACRMEAEAGDEGFSSLSCFIKYGSSVKRLMRVARECFFPEPGVDSVFLSIKPLSAPRVKVTDEGLFWKIIRASFNQRRKTLRASLVGQGIVDWDKTRLAGTLTEIGINKDARPEEISLESFARLADIISSRKGA